MEEKRRFVRVDWPIVVKYKTIEEPYTEDQIVGKDICEGGISFTVYERLTKGVKLELEIYAPFDSLPIFAKGDIVWIKRISEEHAKTFEVGISFFYIDPHDHKRLKMYIEKELSNKKLSGD